MFTPIKNIVSLVRNQYLHPFNLKNVEWLKSVTKYAWYTILLSVNSISNCYFGTEEKIPFFHDLQWNSRLQVWTLNKWILLPLKLSILRRLIINSDKTNQLTLGGFDSLSRLLLRARAGRLRLYRGRPPLPPPLLSFLPSPSPSLVFWNHKQLCINQLLHTNTVKLPTSQEINYENNHC